MKSPYETIGVKKDATSAEIKRVFRAQAASAHPDKAGGDTTRMAELNHAYEILSSPARRLLYDRTGEDDQRPHDEQVRQLLMTLFTDALQKEAPNVLKHCVKAVKDGQEKIKQQQREVKETRKKLQARRDKVTAKGVNMFHALIDNMLAQADQQVAKLDVEAKLGSDALEALKEYSSTEKDPSQLYAQSQSYGQQGRNFGLTDIFGSQI